MGAEKQTFALNLKYQAQYRTESHLQLSNGHSGTDNNINFDKIFARVCLYLRGEALRTLKFKSNGSTEVLWHSFPNKFLLPKLSLRPSS